MLKKVAAKSTFKQSATTVDRPLLERITERIFNKSIG